MIFAVCHWQLVKWKKENKQIICTQIHMCMHSGWLAGWFAHSIIRLYNKILKKCLYELFWVPHITYSINRFSKPTEKENMLIHCHNHKVWCTKWNIAYMNKSNTANTSINKACRETNIKKTKMYCTCSVMLCCMVCCMCNVCSFYSFHLYFDLYFQSAMLVSLLLLRFFIHLFWHTSHTAMVWQFGFRLLYQSILLEKLSSRSSVWIK